MTESLFRRATRYTGPENRLTAVLAAVLERVPGIAEQLAWIWTSPDQGATGEVAWAETRASHEALAGLRAQSIRTQVPTPGGKQVDLALRLGPTAHPSADDVVIWVESKLGADPHDQQLANYHADLPRNVRGAAVVLVAPRGSLPYPPNVVPDGVPQRSWQEAGRHIRAAALQETDAVNAFLLKELIAYMREENLSDPEAVRPEHLVAFAYMDQAEAALERICEVASGHVARVWGRPADAFEKVPRVRTDTPAFGWNYWEAWSLKKGSNGDDVLWLDWNARSDVLQPEAEGRSLFFLSGLTANSFEDLVATVEDRQRHDRLQAGVRIDGRLVRFQRVSDDNYERLARVVFPEEVLIGRTLEEQAAALGAWIIDGFRALSMPVEELVEV